MKVIPWQVFPHIIAGTTLREGGVSTGSLASLNLAFNVKDEPSHVLENRRIFATFLGTDLNHMVSPTQTHSTHLQEVKADDIGRGMYSLEDAFEDTDALYTREKNVFLLTYHADCTPVLLYDDSEQLIAAIHAGWKGNVNEIVLKTCRYLQEHEHCQPQHMYAYIGPSLSYEAFEAREDIISLVRNMEIDSSNYYREVEKGIYRLDAKGLIQEQLTTFGLPLNHITIDAGCTKSEPERFFSYRNDKACGRHASYICMKK